MGALNILVFGRNIYIAGARANPAHFFNGGDLAAHTNAYVAKNGIKLKSVNLILKTFDCALRFEKLPDLSDRDLRGYIDNNLNEYFPMPLIGYTVSYRRWPDGDGAFVCLAAAPDELTLPYIEIFSQLKIKINKIDIFQNASADFLKNENAALVALKKGDHINATLVRNGRPDAARDVHSDGELTVFARMHGLEADNISICAADCESDFISEFLPGYAIRKIDCAELVAAYG